MDERKGFSFLRSFYEAARSLKTKELQAEFLMAVCEYALDGIEQDDLPDEVKVPFILVKPVLEKSRKRSEAGASGGRGNKKEEQKEKANKKQNKSKLKANEKQIESNLQAEGNPLYKSKEIGDRSKEIGDNNIPPPEVVIEKTEGGGGGFSDDDLEIIRFWEQRFGPVSSFRVTNLLDLKEEFGKDITLYAIKEACDHGASSWEYVRNTARNESRRREQRGISRVNAGTGETELSDPYLQQLYEKAKRDGNVV